MEIKDIIPNLNKPVIFRGAKYTLTGSIVRKSSENNELYYLAEILDANGNSVCIVKLSEIERGDE